MTSLRRCRALVPGCIANDRLEVQKVCIAYLTGFEQIASRCSRHLAVQMLLRPKKVGQDHSFPDQGLGQGSPLALEQEDADAGTHILHC